MSNDRCPERLMTSEPGSFARYTIVERQPQIIHRVIADNGYPPEIVAALEAFCDEMVRQPIQPISETAPDVDFWNHKAATYQGLSWLELPWYFAETYFYRRLLEVVRYFQPGIWQGHDPFGPQKREQQQEAAAWLTKHRAEFDGLEPQSLLEVLLYSSLWGNRADLSNLTVLEQARGGLDAREEQQNVLIDDTDRVAALLTAGVERVDFVADNDGRELLFDLALADSLLGQRWAQTVTFHLKDRPFFVSDAMLGDAKALLGLVRNEPLGQRLDGHLAAGRLRLKDHPFWTSYLMFREMPAPLSAELARSDLVILKGDVNYRRLLSDAHWPHTARLKEIASYFPAPFLVLRTLKAEIMVGLEPGQAEKIAAQDPEWLLNGKRGIIQLQTEDEGRKTKDRDDSSLTIGP
jgi:uncharacterized protein with ATP-grasp and redox domains